MHHGGPLTCGPLSVSSLINTFFFRVGDKFSPGVRRAGVGQTGGRPWVYMASCFNSNPLAMSPIHLEISPINLTDDIIGDIAKRIGDIAKRIGDVAN